MSAKDAVRLLRKLTLPSVPPIFNQMMKICPFWIVMSLVLAPFGFASTAKNQPGDPGREKDRNYPADGPFFYANFTTKHFPKEGTSPLKLHFVSYNINFSEKLADIIHDLETIPELRDADFINLQEAIGTAGGTENTVETIAKALNLNYVYAPGCVLFNHDYGNAVLSRWPIADFRKVLLPLSDADNQRVALGVTADLNGKKIQVYSIHLTVKFKDSIGTEKSRALQVKAAVDQIDLLSDLPAFISGDFNNFNPSGWSKVKHLFEDRRFTPAPDRGWTYKTHKITLDHAFVRGLEFLDNGVAYGALGSDHVPIWSDFTL